MKIITLQSTPESAPTTDDAIKTRLGHLSRQISYSPTSFLIHLREYDGHLTIIMDHKSRDHDEKIFLEVLQVIFPEAHIIYSSLIPLFPFEQQSLQVMA
ncbi:MAG: hypothetical protein WD077_13830 [Bacteroidia bacterium]